MGPVQHTIASVVVSGAFALWSRSLPGTVACFLSGIFIDVDHALDFCLAKRKAFFSYKELFSFCAWEKAGKLYLIFHSYELLIALWISIFAFHLNIIWLGIAVGVTFHLLFDRLVNPLRPFVFFWYYRYRKGFEKKGIFPEDYYKKLV
jgi:hypothetical protein